jgi:hypothetical protein
MAICGTLHTFRVRLTSWQARVSSGYTQMYTYLLGACMFLGAWGILFVLVPLSRKPMVWSSLAWGPAGPLSEYWYHKDYWRPTYLIEIHLGAWRFGIEDYLFAFAFGGLCAGVFDLLLRAAGAKPTACFRAPRYATCLFLGVVCVASMGLLTTGVPLHSLHANILVFCIGAGGLLVRKRSWVPPALWTAGICASGMWCFYWGAYFRLFPGLVDQWWYRDTLSGLAVGGVPLEEVVWAWAAALFVGPAVRYCLEGPAGESGPAS